MNAYASLNAQGLVSRLTANSAKAEDLINYLRGDSTFEGTEGTSYRARPDGKLGDIVNSPPLLVSDGEDASYDFLKPPASGGTRGNYRQFHHSDEGIRSHIIDPRTGRPVIRGFSAVTVIARDAATADAWATALFVSGERSAQDDMQVFWQE